MYYYSKGYEQSEYEPTVMQRRIMMSFYATVVIGMFACTACLIWKTPTVASANEERIVVPLPDPPMPLPASVSPYHATPLKLDMVAIEDAWVEVETDGHLTSARLVRAAEKLSFEAFERIRILTGNAPGIELRFNGEPVAGSGTNRRVRTLEFTPEGTRVVG